MKCDFSPDFSREFIFDFSPEIPIETLPGWEVFFVGVPDSLPGWVRRVQPLDSEIWGDRLFLEEGFLFRAWVLQPDDDWEFGVGDRLLEAGFWGLLLPPGVE